MTTLSERAAAFAAEFRDGDLPGDAMDAVKTFLLDTLGVGIAGRAAPLTPKIRAAASVWSGEGRARLLGGGGALSPSGAAFVNGFQIHCQEYDCVHEPAVVHPMASVLSALLAEADGQDAPVGGLRFAAALALSVELACGIGAAVKSPIRFFRPANAGIFGSALGIMRLRGASPDRTADALGYALAFCSGTMQAHVEGKPALPVQIGNAARGAVMAADLASLGIEGPRGSLDGPFGYFSLFEEASDPEEVVSQPGQRWRITEISHKPFPTGRAAHGGLVLCARLRTRIEDPSEIERLTLSGPPLIERLVARKAFEGMAANHARLCFPYLGAVMLADGEVTLDAFTEERMRRPEILRLAERIAVTSDGSWDPAAFTPQFATLVLRSGETFEERLDRLPGSPADPLGREEHLAKFRECVAFGFGEQRDDVADALIEAVDTLETLADVRRLTSLASGNGDIR